MVVSSSKTKEAEVRWNRGVALGKEKYGRKKRECNDDTLKDTKWERRRERKITTERRRNEGKEKKEQKKTVQTLTSNAHSSPSKRKGLKTQTCSQL